MQEWITATTESHAVLHDANLRVSVRIELPQGASPAAHALGKYAVLSDCSDLLRLRWTFTAVTGALVYATKPPFWRESRMTAAAPPGRLLQLVERAVPGSRGLISIIPPASNSISEKLIALSPRRLFA
jgi:hypothetical protein